MEKGKQKIYSIPLILVLVIPLIVYGMLIPTGLSKYPWYSNSEEVLDVFLCCKQKAILFISGLILIFIIIMFVRKEIQGKFWIFIPFGIYVLLDLISSINSIYKEFSFWGTMEQFESVWVIVGYFLICFYAYLVCSRNFFTVFGVFCCIIGAIGTLQLLGIDIYQTALLQRLCMPQRLQGITFHITAGYGRSYCSLSNPNYVGMLCCLTIPVLTMLIYWAKKRYEKILYKISDILMFCSLIGSRSKSGFLILTGCMILLAFLFRKRFINRPIIIFFLIGIISMAAVFCVWKWSGFSDKENIPDTQIRSISTNADNVQIIYDDKVLCFRIDYNKSSLEEAINITDENGMRYSMTEYQGTLYFSEQELSQVTAALVKYGDYIALEIFDGNFYWYFTNQTENNSWQYVTTYGKTDTLISDEIAVYKGLEGKERIVSGRGYIWSRTIPLLKKYILLGGGQDAFTVLFPNHDYLGKAQWGDKDFLITKPHSMYLQIAVSSGILSLIALLVFWGYFFVRTIMAEIKGSLSDVSRAIAIGVFGYLLMGLTNDSNIGVAPIFWLLIGIGLRLLDKEYIEETQ